jgi:uncharacterized membrane protein
MPNNVTAQRKFKRLAGAMMAVSFLGFVDAAYLTISRFQNAYLPCNLSHGCDIVTTSEYSVILGIPVVLLGVLYYLSILFSAYAFLEYGSLKYFKYTAAFTGVGFLFSAWFVYVQVGILEALCQYCLVSAFTSTILFALGIIVLKTSGSSPSPNANAQE